MYNLSKAFFHSIVFPSDETSLHQAAWTWVERILDGSDCPHFMFVVTKTDTLDRELFPQSLTTMKNKLVKFLEAKSAELQRIRVERLHSLTNELAEIQKVGIYGVLGFIFPVDANKHMKVVSGIPRKNVPLSHVFLLCSKWD